MTRPVSPSLRQHYTGTENQPDTVSIFYKGDKQNKVKIADEEVVNLKVGIADEEVVNSLGHSPFNFASAIERIQVATKKILNGTSEKNDDRWNAFKNLGRGLVQLVPLAGNAILYVYDKARTHFTHFQIKASLADVEGPVVGIAFDGKIITTFASEKLKNANNPLAVAQNLWYSIQQQELDKVMPETRLQLVGNFKQALGNS